MNRLRPIAAALTLWAAQTTVFAQPVQQADALEGNLTFSSDYMHRGASRSGRDASMAGELSYLTQVGIFGSLRGATVDAVAPDFDDHGELELRYALGYRNLWHQNWSWSAQLNYYDYPAADEGSDPHYAELQFSTTYRDWLTGKVAYSNDYLNTDESGIAYEVGATYPLARGVSLLGSVGYVDVGDFYDTTYLYGAIGLQKSWKNVDFSVLYHETEDDATDVFGELAEDQFLIKATTRF